MDYQEGKERFIEAWGRMANVWGIPPAMARVHALLLISPEPLTAEEVQQQLGISVGSANTNLRKLVEWELISKKNLPGERRERFEAEKNMWVMVQKIIAHRKEKELEPVLAELQTLSQVRGECKGAQCFQKVVSEMCTFSRQADRFLDFLAHTEHIRALHLLGRVIT
ncbi:MAG: transcriptional regulator [Saprospiraceae bacterium]|nr:transcriptional regulator [Saprospiraceae bacterium]MDW8229951.1 transcriptional regulator [Saprospiraceae bacterium]